MYRAIVCLLIASLASGCYSESVVHGTSVVRLQRGQHRQAIVLRDVNGGRVHVDPRSKLRFYRVDGDWTAWVYARDLRVSREGVFHRGRGNDNVAGLRWEHIRGIEVQNLSGGKTYAAVVGITLIVAAIAVIIVAMVAGKGGGGSAKGLKVPRFRGGGSRGFRVARGAGSAARGLARAARGVGYNLARAWSNGWRWYGPEIRIHVHAPSHPYEAPPGSPPPGSPPPGTPPSGTDPSAGAPPPPPPAPGAGGAPTTPPQASGPLYVPRGQTSPLFSRLAIRRSRIRFVASMEGGSDFTINDGGAWTAFLGLRLRDIFEIGGGVRMSSFVQPDPVQLDQRVRHWVGFFRFLLHFEVDPWRRVALPFGFDVGGGNPTAYVRAIIGLRVRIFDGLSVGVYPFNPTFTYLKDEGPLAEQRGYDGWSFPTTFELSYAF